MTVETPFGTPERGCECPPEGCLIPSMTNSSKLNTTFESNRRKFSKSEKTQQSNISPLQRKAQPPRQNKQANGNKMETENSGNANPSTSIEEASKAEQRECNNGDGGTASIGRAGKNDLKKSPKTKGSTGEGASARKGTEKSRSRKSMRLRLRRGRTDDGDDFPGPKERPRYVEDLTEIDFTDENIKIKFMDALGMSPRCIPLKERWCTASETVIEDDKQSLGVSWSSSEPEMKDFALDDDAELSPNASGDILPQMTLHHDDLSNEMESFSAPPVQVLLVRCVDEQMESDNDDGWKHWAPQIPYSSTDDSGNTPPSQREINGSLQRLITLGTEVRRIFSDIC